MAEYAVCPNCHNPLSQHEWVKVLRCKDCRKFHLDNSDHDYRSGWWCDRWDTDMIEPDGFCAWGERASDSDKI